MSSIADWLRKRAQMHAQSANQAVVVAMDSNVKTFTPIHPDLGVALYSTSLEGVNSEFAGHHLYRDAGTLRCAGCDRTYPTHLWATIAEVVYLHDEHVLCNIHG